uniref:Similarity n=2 Tax=Microcystis aeruginosa (strain PCC 7806) TaxID=267872 RepID=A8YL86_MICA7|nr:unnamed protein product [Microcystis aeruginosa PCC 7806]
MKRMNGNTLSLGIRALVSPNLLPIREAYEWKPKLFSCGRQNPPTCFQFVKRMNGNVSSVIHHTIGSMPCFQFVKRMNGNFFNIVLRDLGLTLLPIREAYEWKRCVGLIHELTLQFF